jgi:hypothetical protein
LACGCSAFIDGATNASLLTQTEKEINIMPTATINPAKCDREYRKLVMAQVDGDSPLEPEDLTAKLESLDKSLVDFDLSCQWFEKRKAAIELIELSDKATTDAMQVSESIRKLEGLRTGALVDPVRVLCNPEYSARLTPEKRSLYTRLLELTNVIQEKPNGQAILQNTRPTWIDEKMAELADKVRDTQRQMEPWRDVRDRAFSTNATARLADAQASLRALEKTLGELRDDQSRVSERGWEAWPEPV